MTSREREVRALGELDRPIHPGPVTEEAIERQMLTAFDDAAAEGMSPEHPPELVELGAEHEHDRQYGRARLVLAAAAALVLIAGAVTWFTRESTDDIAATQSDRAIVESGVERLCRNDVPELVMAFETYRAATNPYRNESRDEPLVRARAEFIEAVEMEIAAWPATFRAPVDEHLATARSENDRARDRLGQPAPLIDVHHGGSHEALAAIFDLEELSAMSSCDGSVLAWRPAG